MFFLPAEKIKSGSDPDHDTMKLIFMACHPFFLFGAADTDKKNPDSGSINGLDIAGIFFLC
nr:hypothetical protein [Desulfobacula sp.]